VASCLSVGLAAPIPMTIVTYRRQPKRKRPTKAVPAAIVGPRIVSAKGPGKAIRSRKEIPVDPEAEIRLCGPCRKSSDSRHSRHQQPEQAAGQFWRISTVSPAIRSWYVCLCVVRRATGKE
jgi:hypothetical protein